VSGVWWAVVGYTLGQVEYVWHKWREAKAKVNEARLQHDLPIEKRWWRL
jgi:hypothetical protein